MENSSVSLQNQLFSFIKENKLIVALFLGGMIFLGIGLIQFFPKAENTIEFKKGGEVEAASTSAVPSEILVDVSGEVKNPGVYALPQSARVQDALKAAGGLNVNADYTYVSKMVNLASAVRDGMKIYIPHQGEASINTSVVLQSSGDVGIESTSGVVSINNASESDLENLPGIGPVTAGKIIASRPYSSIEDLINNKVIGQSTFNKIKDQIGL